MKKVWKVKRSDESRVKELSRQLGISYLLAQVLVNRGVRDVATARAFLRTSVDALPDPFLLAGMREAIGRVNQAIRKGEKITIYGDFDVDGMTAVSLLFEFLRGKGANVSYYIPSRLEEGYGLNTPAIEALAREGTELLITVDCGANSPEEVSRARELGMEVIVTDHHQIYYLPQDALAIINPRQTTCLYPFKELSGVGVAFKLCQGLEGGDLTPGLKKHLDLVALGTIADLVPLQGENRVLGKWGMEQLSRTKKPGIRALLEGNGLGEKDLNSYHVGFILAPRLNACGRIGDAYLGVNLLLTRDHLRAKDIVRILERENRTRQRLEEKIYQEALSWIEDRFDFSREKVILLAREGWHRGVMGIVASRLVERFYRPVALISLKDGMGKGSARSISGFPIFKALQHCQEILSQFGGHSLAAGFSLEESKIPSLKGRLNELAGEWLEEEELQPKWEIDASIPLSSIDLSLAEELSLLQPFGKGNEEPLFMSQGVEVVGYPRVVDNNHLKIRVREGKVVIPAVGFRMGDWGRRISTGSRVSLAYSVEIDSWKDPPGVQLKIKDIEVERSS